MGVHELLADIVQALIEAGTKDAESLIAVQTLIYHCCLPEVHHIGYISLLTCYRR